MGNQREQHQPSTEKENTIGFLLVSTRSVAKKEQLISLKISKIHGKSQKTGCVKNIELEKELVEKQNERIFHNVMERK